MSKGPAHIPVVYVLMAVINPQNIEEVVGNGPLVSGVCVVPSNQLSHRASPRSANHRASGRLITTQLPPQTRKHR